MPDEQSNDCNSDHGRYNADETSHVRNRIQVTITNSCQSARSPIEGIEEVIKQVFFSFRINLLLCIEHNKRRNEIEYCQRKNCIEYFLLPTDD